MTPNPKKSASPWCACEKCQVRLSQKDVSIHDLNCPPSTEKWNHSYIQNGILYSTLEVFQPQELPKNISDHAANDMVFMAQSALQLCEIPIADPVVLFTKDNVVVKTAWPTSDKTLTSVSLTKSALELNKLEGLVKAKKLKSNLHLAKEFIIESVGKHHPSKKSTEVDILIKGSNERKIFCIGNRISISYYGRKLVFKIVDAKADKIDDESLEDKSVYQDLLSDLERMNVSENDESNVKFYKALFSTKWTIIDSKPEEEKEEPSKPRNRMEDVGGYDDLIVDLRVVVDIALGKYKVMKGFNITKGVLLYGTAGVGKSMIANALISEYDAEPFNVTGPEIYSKYVGETESKLREIFNDAKLKAPSIILMEDIDILCPRRTSSTTDQERRVIATLLKLLDELQNSNANVLVLATTSRIDSLDGSLRRPGRIDKEFEVCVPTPSMRHEIFLKFLLRVPNTLTDDDIKKISFVTHGFVGADLYSLCSRAATHAIQYQKESVYGKDDVKVSMEDFNYALTIVKPSAMKEVRVEVPDVRWSDIGGQDDLKLKLKQAVEWPLQHPEAFVRLGITPPRGVLMFGPPGCSKTMIAKALATESKLNFLNIKGPELFSKWVGESERAVREVFRKARQVAPSIVFIDEIDALGSERTSANAGGSNVQERVLAQLLTELDGVTALGNVTLVAATNRPDKIDKALLRPGRLDRIVYVPLPDAKTRKEIFDIKLRKMPVSKDVVIQDLVELTEGYSGAEVQAICHEAAMKALEHDLNATTITKKHFKTALSIVIPRTPTSLIKLYEDYITKSM